MSGTLVDYGAKDLKVYTFPYLFDNLKHARAVQKSEVGQKLLDSIQKSGTKMVGLGTYQESGRNYFFTNKAVKSISDLKGMKIRCQEGSIYTETMQVFGASPVSISFSELYSALQTGIVDGAEQPLSGFYSNQYYEVCKNYLMDGHEISPNIVLFSEISWNKLKPEEQKVIKEAFDESVTYFNDLSDKSDAETLNKMKEKGVQIIEPSNPQEWRDAVKGIYTKYASEYQSTIDAIRAVKY
jgi:tripartite ATP-independent transporter DctP family solute receptor